MTYKMLAKQLEKAIDNLSTSLESDEFLYVQADSKALHDLIEKAKVQVQMPQSIIIKFQDFPFKDKCKNMIKEGEFYLAEANDFLN